jgi:hypothetical protein
MGSTPGTSDDGTGGKPYWSAFALRACELSSSLRYGAYCPLFWVLYDVYDDSDGLTRSPGEPYPRLDVESIEAEGFEMSCDRCEFDETADAVGLYWPDNALFLPLRLRGAGLA